MIVNIVIKHFLNKFHLSKPPVKERMKIGGNTKPFALLPHIRILYLKIEKLEPDISRPKTSTLRFLF